jgi:6,7-dimethyl-8-ribityllumazine synthase
MTQPSGAEIANDRLPSGVRIASIASTYHAELTGAMAASAARTLRHAGLDPDGLLEFSAPGAYELPILAQACAAREDVDAVLCFGLVLRGETDHDRYISASVADALQRVGLEHGKPVLFGVLTCNTLDQARARARTADEGGLDKGREGARAAIAALATLDRIRTAEVARSEVARSEVSP